MIQVIIPTYNRSKCIELLLKECIDVYHGIQFKFVILDSSTNNETENITKNYSKVEYRRFDSTIKVDDKVIGSILECCEDYYWLLGDGNLVDFSSIEYLIGRLPDFDVLEVDSSNSKRNIKTLEEDYESHDDLLEYIKNRYSHLTYWGATIVKTKTTQEIFRSGTMDKYREDDLSWWSAALICEMISISLEKELKPRIYTLFTKAFYNNPEKKEQSWANGENYFLTTFKVFDKDVYMLPQCFNDVKKDIIKIFRDDFLVTKTYLVHLKRRGVIKMRYVLKYKDAIQDVNGYFPFILMLACIPNFCIEIACKALKLLKGGKL